MRAKKVLGILAFFLLTGACAGVVVGYLLKNHRPWLAYVVVAGVLLVGFGFAGLIAGAIKMAKEQAPVIAGQRFVLRPPQSPAAARAIAWRVDGGLVGLGLGLVSLLVSLVVACGTTPLLVMNACFGFAAIGFVGMVLRALSR